METITLKNNLSSFIGLSREKTNSFLGIKYADSKRFEKPILKTSYESIYDATKYGPCCPQMRTYIPEDENSMYFREFRENLEFTYDEDCLSLNIFSPKDATFSAPYPVLIYIHGGSFTRGSSSERPFDGSNLAKKGLIVVTINYRLNIFGTFQGKNLMLYDMKCAIEWVYKNISEFGGDSQNITLAGQSAGAMSSQLLILNDEIKKMVRRSILISGGGCLKGIFGPKNKIFAKSFYKDIEKYLKKQGLDALKCTPNQLFDSFHYVCKKRPLNAAIMAVFPVFDNEIVKKLVVYSVLKKNKEKKQIDCLLSTTKDDLNPRSYLEKSAKNYASKLNKFSKAKVYLVKMNHGLPPENKAFHSSDLWYFFGNLDQHTWRKFSDKDFEISEQIMSRVVSFCSTGKLDFEPNYYYIYI